MKVEKDLLKRKWEEEKLKSRGLKTLPIGKSLFANDAMDC